MCLAWNVFDIAGVTAVDPVLHEYSFASQLVKGQRKKNEHGRESHMFQHL